MKRTLQERIAEVLTAAGMPFHREVILSKHDRIDFMVGTIGIEIKVDGSRADVARQLLRYTEHCKGLILITTRSRHQLPDTLGGKPLKVIRLENAF